MEADNVEIIIRGPVASFKSTIAQEIQKHLAGLGVAAVVDEVDDGTNDPEHHGRKVAALRDRFVYAKILTRQTPMVARANN